MPLPPLAEPRSALARAWSVVRVSPVLAALFSSLVFLNGVQVASLVVRPFSRPLFRRVNRALADLWWGWCVLASRHCLGIAVRTTGDDPPPRENAVVYANHQQMADIPFLFFLARAKGRLGDMKWFVKAPVKWVPGVGWGMQFLDCLFVKRDWTRDAAAIKATFARIVDGRVPVWLLAFSEGTRLTPRKLESAQRYAQEHGMPLPRHVLIPRTKGFVASIEGLRGHVDAVYDITIGYVGGVPSLWQYVRGLAPLAHLHVRRYPIATLPESPEALTEWLLARFREKDDLLEAFYRDGVFPG